jgi:transcriptional regulator with XRE-family HTH domain
MTNMTTHNSSSAYRSDKSEPDLELEQERFILDLTEMITELMLQTDTSRSELASLLKTSRGNVTQILSGARNLTVRTLCDVVGALGFRVLPRAMPLKDSYTSYLIQRTPGCLLPTTSAGSWHLEELRTSRPTKPRESAGVISWTRDLPCLN